MCTHIGRGLLSLMSHLLSTCQYPLPCYFSLSSNCTRRNISRSTVLPLLSFELLSSIDDLSGLSYTSLFSALQFSAFSALRVLCLITVHLPTKTDSFSITQVSRTDTACTAERRHTNDTPSQPTTTTYQ